jgi:hypothetical protein
VSAGPLPSYQGVTNATGPPVPPPDPGDGELAEVFVTVAVRTSAGPDPGPKRLPVAEASALVNERRAVWGSQPPRGWPG